MASGPGFPTTGYLVWRLSTKFRAAADRALAPLGLTHAQYALAAALYGLARDGTRPSQRELADFSGLEPMYVSKLARTLEQDGVVVRAQNPTDPRAFSLALTARGEDIVARAIRVIFALEDELTAPIGGRGGARTSELRATLEALLAAPPTGRDEVFVKGVAWPIARPMPSETKSETRTTTDHDEIRRWVEAHGGKPATVRGTGDGEPGVLRIDFPGGTGEDQLEHISWDEWFQKFDRENLAFLYQDHKASGEDSTFFKLVRR
jgi:DNA-binding MarR family transcriptional regulator